MNPPLRRELSFGSFDEIIADMEQLASDDHYTSGNHSFAAIVEHLAKTNDMLTGEIVPPKLPLMYRMLMPLMRGRIFSSPVTPGFKLPQDMQEFFWEPKNWELSEAIEHFKASVKNYQQKGPLPVHPVFGPATPDQTMTVTMRHAAMHLSFVHPGQPASPTGVAV